MKRMKHFVSYEAQCPFYMEESRKVIYCEGLTENSRIHNAFSTDARAFKKKYCCGGWKSCPIAIMLWAKYE